MGSSWVPGRHYANTPESPCRLQRAGMLATTPSGYRKRYTARWNHGPAAAHLQMSFFLPEQDCDGGVSLT